MTDDGKRTPDAPGGFSLRRWSQRKLAAARETRETSAAPSTPIAPAAVSSVPDPLPAVDTTAPTLPSIESLTTDSDFTPFMRSDVDRGLQHKALRKLFADPHFNVMDGLDVYIDDYSKPDPISADLVAGLAQARYIFDPPITRIDENGCVVDAPPSPQDEAALPGKASPDALSTAPSATKADAAPEGAIASASAATKAPPPGEPPGSDATGSATDVPDASGHSGPQ